MKKTIMVIISLICCISLTSCNFNISDFIKPKPYNPQEIDSNDHPFAEETMEEVLRCLDEEDSESLKKLLSQEILDRPETDDEIEEIMDVYDGKLASYDIIRNGIMTSASSGGKYKQKSIYIITQNLVTDTDFCCNVNVYYILVDEDTNRIGIHSISITNKAGVDMCAVNSLNIQ